MEIEEIKGSAIEVRRIADTISKLTSPTPGVLTEMMKEFVSESNNLLRAFNRVLNTRIQKS